MHNRIRIHFCSNIVFQLGINFNQLSPLMVTTRMFLEELKCLRDVPSTNVVLFTYLVPTADHVLLSRQLYQAVQFRLSALVLVFQSVDVVQ